MDVSREYIEMCEKAQEIQISKKHYYLRDEFFYNRYGEICTVVNIDINEGCNIPKLAFFDDSTLVSDWVKEEELSKLIWLPRQDQLQEMIEIDEYLLENKTRGLRLAEHCEGWCLSDKYMEQFETMEQLWLATVMKEKYNKQWNPENKEWEKV